MMKTLNNIGRQGNSLTLIKDLCPVCQTPMQLPHRFTFPAALYENSSFSTFFNTCYFLCFFNQWMKSQKITIHTPLRLWLCLPRLQRNQSI